MQLKNLNILLNQWGKYVVQQSRSRLTKGKKNVDKNLYNSIKYNLESNQKGSTLFFEMLDYGKFQDQGVKGKDPSIIDKWTKGRLKGKQKAPNSPFSYKSKMPPSTPLANWAKKRGIRLRNDKGQFVRGNYKSIGYVLSKFIYAQGIKPSLFFTKSLETSRKRYSNELAKALAKDIEDNIKNK